jgi:hypothetical protein
LSKEFCFCRSSRSEALRPMRPVSQPFTCQTVLSLRSGSARLLATPAGREPKSRSVDPQIRAGTPERLNEASHRIRIRVIRMLTGNSSSTPLPPRTSMEGGVRPEPASWRPCSIAQDLVSRPTATVWRWQPPTACCRAGRFFDEAEQGSLHARLHITS